jgi:hypothetical protein
MCIISGDRQSWLWCQTPGPRLIVRVCVVGRAYTLRAKEKGLEAVKAFGSLGCDINQVTKVSVCANQAVADTRGGFKAFIADDLIMMYDAHRTTSATSLPRARRDSPSSTAPRSR